MAISQIERGVTSVAAAVGTPPDIIKTALCLLLNFPLCGIVKRLPAESQRAKEIFVLSVGVLYIIGIFSLAAGFINLVSIASFTYVLTRVWKSSALMPWTNFLVVILHLMLTHIREQWSGEDYVNNMGISGAQMILVIKLTSYAWDVYDGGKPKADLSETQQLSRVTEPPSFLRYLSWCFFFPAVLTSPSCTYREYSDWLDLSMFSILAKPQPLPSQSPRQSGSASPRVRSPSLAKRSPASSEESLSDVNGPDTKELLDKLPVALRIPQSGHMALLKAIEGGFWAFLYFQSANYVSSEYLFTAEYTARPFIQRILYLWLLAFSYQLKYFVAWTFTDAACIHSGIGFNGLVQGKDGSVRKRWDRLTNVRPLAVISAQNAHSYINNWNINTSKWLRNYVYLRVTPKGRKPGTVSTLATFVTSAFWHGTRSGYYLTFVLAAALQIFGKLYRRRLRPVFVGTSYELFYHICTWVNTQLAFGFAVQPFVLLNIGPSLRLWANVYFYVVLVLAASWVVLAGPLKKLSSGLLHELKRDIAQNE